MRAENRWLVFFLAVIVVLIVAMWPRGGASPAPGSGGGEGSAPPGTGPAGTVGAAAGPGSPEQGCATPAPPTSAVGDLAGVMVGCLGSEGRVDLGAALSGEVTVLNLWASWCAPCRSEMPVLDAYAGEPGAVRVVGINTRDDPAAASGLLAELGVGYRSYRGTEAVTAALSAPAVLPLTYLVRADGSVHRIGAPAVFTDPAQVRAAVAGLVG